VFDVGMHVVVVGCGRVGSELAVALTDRDQSVAIVDKNPTAFRRLPERWPGRVVVGYGFDRDHLEEAGVREAGALAAVTSGDNSNILTARIARETYQVPSVVARIYDPRRAVIYQRVGIPTVATVTWTTDQVLRRLFPEVSTSEWTDSSGQLVLLERTLPASWAARRLGQLHNEGRVTLVAVTRGGVPRLDVADMVGQEGDLLHLLVRKEAVDDLEGLLEMGPR
jgi:trk system potassium uptake protein TrkA